MESIDVNLDKIIDILYDEKLLHWHRVKSGDIIIFGHQKFNLHLSDPEINYVLTFLIDEGYIREFKEDNRMTEFALTLKGVQLKQNGGFKKQTCNRYIINSLLYVSYVAIIIAGLYYALEIIKFFFLPPR